MKRLLSLVIVLSLALTLYGAAETGPIIVSIGDSYASGEGIEPFFGQDLPVDAKIHDQDWLAHRSALSWPALLRFDGLDGTTGENKGKLVKNESGKYELVQEGNWFFVASSGAVINHLYASQHKSVNVRSGFSRLKASEDIYPQLEVFGALDAYGLKADYVTVMLGGNDMGFGWVIALGLQSTVFGGGPAQQTSLEDLLNGSMAAFDSENGVKARLTQAYRDISEAAGPQATLIVVGYPTLLNEEGSALFGAEESRLINEATKWFNGEIENIVNGLNAEGMKICFVSVEEPFYGHEAYCQDAYINPIILGTKAEDLDTTSSVSGYSVHPNAVGAAAIAACAQQKIDGITE